MHIRICESASSISFAIVFDHFVQIYKASPSTILSLTLVNKSFYPSTFIFKNRHQTFTFRNDDDYKGSINTLDLIEALIDDLSKAKIRQSIRHITIINRQTRGRNGWAEGSELEISAVIRLLGSLSNLESFTFK